MDPMTLMLILGGLGSAGSIAGSMLQKKPQQGHMAVIGSDENPGYPTRGGSMYVGADAMGQPDNRMAEGVGNAGGILGSMAGKFGMGGGGAGSFGSAAPMANTAAQYANPNLSSMNSQMGMGDLFRKFLGGV